MRRFWTSIGLSLALGGLTLPASAAQQQADNAALADRVTWGRTPATLAEVNRLGADKWLKAQLRPAQAAKLPAPVQARIDAMPLSRTPMAETVIAMNDQAKTAEKIRDGAARQEAQLAYQRAMQDLRQQAAARSLLRAVYSPNQLQEQMTWFWFNHFNVQAEKRDIRAMVGDYEDTALRPHALGKFRDLLKAADLHPAMLRYLDNDQNEVGRINENYAREILELHTMGVGSGYTQKDVEEMARVLTGVGVNASGDPPSLKPEQKALYTRVGVMEFNPARHDGGEKTVLRHKISATGLGEFEEALDLLAKQPATARHVSTKLAAYFMDSAPPKLIDRMTATFLRSDGDIASVLDVLFNAPEFRASLGKKMKDPVHYVVSAVRISYEGQTISNTTPLQGWISRLGQGLHARDTPDGYPLGSAAWSSPNQLSALFELARQIGWSSAGLFKTDDGTATTRPASPQLQTVLTASAGLTHLSPATQTALAQARSPAEWNTLFLSSPEFLYR